jgi:ankyrin repeat protein
MSDQSGRFECINLEYLKKHVNSENANEKDLIYYRTSIHWAALQNKPDCIQYLLNIGCNILKYDCFDWPAIYLASVYGHSECVKILIDAGANIEDRGGIHSTNYTSLHGAILNNHFETAYLLIDRGAKIENVDIDTRSITSIPRLITEFIEHRKQHRHSAIIVLGLKKYRMPNTFQSNGRDAIRLIGKHIWSLRMPR